MGLLAFIVVADIVLGFPAAANLAFLAPVSIATYRGGLKNGLPIFVLTTVASTMILAYSGQIQHGGLLSNVIIEAILMTAAILGTERTRKNLSDSINRSKIDTLTNAHNRASILEAGTQAVQRSLMSGQPLSVAVIDLDHFKELNDGYGHAFGDAVLKDLVKTLTLNLEKSDIVGRTGGDEFVVVMPNRSLEEAEAVMIRVNNMFSDRTFVAGHPISFSYGLACPARDGLKWATLLDAADQDMYRRKSAKKARLAVRQVG